MLRGAVRRIHSTINHWGIHTRTRVIVFISQSTMTDPRSIDGVHIWTPKRTMDQGSVQVHNTKTD
jgi:hypothetical protein